MTIIATLHVRETSRKYVLTHGGGSDDLETAKQIGDLKVYVGPATVSDTCIAGGYPSVRASEAVSLFGGAFLFDESAIRK